jgi:hypothetical protein
MLLSSRPGMGSPQAVVRSSATAVTPPGLLRNLDATIPARPRISVVKGRFRESESNSSV